MDCSFCELQNVTVMNIIPCIITSLQETFTDLMNGQPVYQTLQKNDRIYYILTIIILIATLYMYQNNKKNQIEYIV